MNFSESLKKNKDFGHVYKRGKSYANRYLVMYYWKMERVETVWGYLSVKKLVTVL